MDQNAPIESPEPANVTEKKKFSLAPVISLLTGILAHGLFVYSFFAPMKVWVGALLGFLSALVAVVSGAKAKKQASQSGAGKLGRWLGWLYIIGAVLLIILVIMGLVGGISLFGGLLQTLGIGQ